MNKAVFHFVMLRAEKGEILHCLQELHSAGGEYLEDIPPAMKLSLSEKRIREIFYIGVILKGIDGVIETIAGFALMFVSHAQLGTVVSFFTREELFEDPHDTIANYLTHSFHTFSGASQHFSALYLCSSTAS